MQIIYMSGTPLQGSHIPYKVWGTIRVTDSYKVPTCKSYTCQGPHCKVLSFQIRNGGSKVIDSYKVPTFNERYGGPYESPCYKVPTFHISIGGPYESLIVTKFPHCR